MRIHVQWDKSGISGLKPGPLKSAVVRALRKAGATALRDMRGEAVKRIRARKKIKPAYVRDALRMRKASGSKIESLEWALVVSGKPVPLIAYPHRAVKRRRMGKRVQGPRDRGGVVVEVNVGKKTLVRGAFIATMKSGHEGIFVRLGRSRLPIREMLGSRPVDALLHRGESEAVAARGGKSLAETFTRLLPLEILGKGAKGKSA